jgi:hypothetical protein
MGVNKIKFLYRFLLIAYIGINNYQPGYAISKLGGTITNYRSTLLPVQDQQGRLQIVIRLFNQNKELYALLVDPYSLAVSQASFSVLTLRKAGVKGNLPGYFTWQELEDTPYMRLIRDCVKPPYPLQNDGIKHALGDSEGYFLTVDMCPSSKPFEKEFFDKLIQLKSSSPFEVGISISGLWILGHPEEFAWLCEQNNNGNLRITWINHTFRHLYFHDLPLEKNFMRFSPIELDGQAYSSFIQITLQDEELMAEQLLLEHGQLPSVFFRFPGLVSDEGLMRCLSNMGLIPLGADAWLAKGEVPQLGSIILVHGNGNEKPGITKIMQWLDKKDLKWLPLMHLAQAKL